MFFPRIGLLLKMVGAILALFVLALFLGPLVILLLPLGIIAYIIYKFGLYGLSVVLIFLSVIFVIAAFELIIRILAAGLFALLVAILMFVAAVLIRKKVLKNRVRKTQAMQQ